MQLLPKWLTRNDDDFEFPPIPTAAMPIRESKMDEPTEMQTTNGAGNGIDLSAVPARDILQQAAVLADKYEGDKARWSRLADEAGTRIKDLSREADFLRLELATRTNDVQTLQAQIEELRQDNSELRALHGALHAQARHLVSQYENFSIPLPIRKRAKNGNKEKPVVVEIPKEAVDEP